MIKRKQTVFIKSTGAGVGGHTYRLIFRFKALHLKSMNILSLFYMHWSLINDLKKSNKSVIKEPKLANVLMLVRVYEIRT